MPLKVSFTIDMEQDCVSFLKGFRGVEEGTPPLLDLLEEENVKATFFTTGQVAKLYPKTVEKIVADGHELGSHGDTHKAFTLMDKDTARKEIQDSVKVLRQFAPVTSFRAPFLKFPNSYLHLLEEENFLLDSSQAKYNPNYYKKPWPTRLNRIPVSITSSALRLPKWILTPYLKALSYPVVLYVHPWEFVDLRKEKMRFDCRFKTGKVALECVRWVLKYFKKKNADFVTMGDLGSA